MSEAIAFDTHRFVKRLTYCGFTGQQAETLAEGHVALLNGNLATKTDIAEIKADIARLEARIEASRSDLMRWMIGLLIAQGGLIIAFIKFL